VQYTVQKQTAKETISLHKEVLIIATSLEDVIPKFHKFNTSKRGLSFTIDAISKYSNLEVIH
jgi:hypothetical protein